MTKWQIRQNYKEQARHHEIRVLILELGIVFCPFGRDDEEKDKINSGEYNTTARNQDKKFVEVMKIGDIIYIVAPIDTGLPTIVAEITSDIYECDTRLLYKDIEHSSNSTPFAPLVRNIKILDDDHPYKGKCPLSLCKIK